MTPSERIQEILMELRTKRTGNYDELSLAPTLNDAILVYLDEEYEKQSGNKTTFTQNTPSQGRGGSGMTGVVRNFNEMNGYPIK